MAAWHGRLLVLDREAAAESTGHGSPLPMLKHGGPGRAGGGEELGGIRAVKHYLQRAAVQGSPTMLAAVTGEYVRGATLQRRRRPSVPQALRGARDRRLAADASPHRERGRHRRLRRHLGRLLLHALRRDRGEGVGVRQAHRPRLLRAVGGGGPVRLAGARAGARQLRPRHAALRQAGRRSATRSARASPASARSTATSKDAQGRGPGRRRLGRRGDEPGRRGRRELRHPDAGRQARASRPADAARRREGKPLRTGSGATPRIAARSHAGEGMAPTRRADKAPSRRAGASRPAHPQEVSEPAPLRHRGLELHHARPTSRRWC